MTTYIDSLADVRRAAARRTHGAPPAVLARIKAGLHEGLRRSDRLRDVATKCGDAASVTKYAHLSIAIKAELRHFDEVMPAPDLSHLLEQIVARGGQRLRVLAKPVAADDQIDEGAPQFQVGSIIPAMTVASNDHSETADLPVRVENAGLIWDQWCLFVLGPLCWTG
jgi:hypothetical protein